MNLDDIRAFPKVQLHDHLDGGLRPSTIIELADAVGYSGLPDSDPEALAAWFTQTVKVGGLPGYLKTFDHTIAVLQTADALERVAYEAVVDLAADGVVYAEIRFAPELNTRQGLGLDDVLEAALAGLDRGSTETGTDVGLIVDGMRHDSRTTEAARAAVRWRDAGVVGFDIAGPEAGYPPEAHLEAFGITAAGGLGITIHAGEADGLASIASALHECGAQRIGHGVRIVDDIEDDRLGPIATEIRDRRIPLEMCPRSNVDTGAVLSLADHPIDRLLRLGFTVTVSCDNRLMSGTSPVTELAALVDAFGWGMAEVAEVTRNAAAAAFAPPQRVASLLARIDR
ncbi:MAG: adenosine deaminase [Acidimicrobiia bacterium]|nr:adenosine deaminase [Acidimicrobiia bacterium]